ncbi:MAG: addiction module protein [Fimbriimonadaceae bacterium]
MTDAMRQAWTLAQSLTDVERADLAQALIASLDAELVRDQIESLDETLSRRAAGVRNGTAEGRPASEVFADLRARPS